jgi:hypothetical protein
MLVADLARDLKVRILLVQNKMMMMEIAETRQHHLHS